MYIGVKPQHLRYTEVTLDLQKEGCGTQAWQLHMHSLDSVGSFKGHYIQRAESPCRWSWLRMENVCSHALQVPHWCSFGWTGLPQRLDYATSQASELSGWFTLDHETGNEQQTTWWKHFCICSHGMPSHACTHELREWPCLWLCWKMVLSLQRPCKLYLFSLQCHISSPLPWHLPPKKPVSRSGQLTAPAQAPSQKGELGIVVGVWMLSGRAGVNLWCNREVWYYLLHKFLLPPPLLSKFLNTEKLRLNVQFISRNVNVNLNI